MKTYIAVNELHVRPDLKQPQLVIKAGHPFEAPSGFDVSDLVKGGVLRDPTPDEVKRFDIEVKKAEPAKKAADDKPKGKAADADDKPKGKATDADAGKSDAGKSDDGKSDDAADKLV